MGNEDRITDSVEAMSRDETLSRVFEGLGLTDNTSSLGKSQNHDGGGDVFSSLFSNPELLAKLPTIISSVKPIIDMLGRSGGEAGQSIPSAAISRKSEAQDTQKTPQKPGADSRTALLCALKPYLGEDRRRAIDYIVKLSKLGDILKTL